MTKNKKPLLKVMPKVKTKKTYIRKKTTPVRRKTTQLEQNPATVRKRKTRVKS